MHRIAFLLLALPVLAFNNDVWKSGSIKVVDTDEWCGRPGIPDWPGICGQQGATRALFSDAHGDSVRPANPFSQILEIDAPDAIYIVRRTSLDGGLQFQPGAIAQFAVDGKHLKIKFDRQEKNRRGEIQVRHDHDRTDLLELRKR